VTQPATISVIIPSYRRLERLPGLVERYLDQDADQVVIVLDGPHEGWRTTLARELEDPRVTIVELPTNRGLALARIAGLTEARADLILATDDDVIPQPGLVARHRAFHASHRDHVLMGYMPVELPARRGRDEAATYLYASDYEKQVDVWRKTESSTLLGSLWGGNISLPRELYLRAEHHKPSQRLNYNEDLDLGIRLDQLGAIAEFDDGALALHQHHRDFAGYTAECVVRGEAVADLEQRWGFLPAQLIPLVRIPRAYRPQAAWLQRRIASRNTKGMVEGCLQLAYRVAGVLHAWSVQDAIARLIRRGLAIRGYRMQSARNAITSGLQSHKSVS
jgi:glycosyltransferase involved in cell wall biosynthesis